MAAGARSVFGAGRAKVETEDFEGQCDERHAKIGQWTVGVDFLRKKSKPLGRWGILSSWSKKIIPN